MKIIGYFVDIDGDITDPKDIYVAIAPVSKDKIEVYCPVGQHHEASKDYVNVCKKITKEEYLFASEGYYTPADYL